MKYIKSLFQGENKTKKIILISAFLIALICLGIFYFTYGKEIVAFVSDTQKFKAWLDSFGWLGKIVFIAIRALQTVVKFIPAEPLEIGAGFAFGVWGGLFYCMLGTFIGSLIIILITSLFGMKAINLFVPKEKIESLSFLQDSSSLSVTLFFVYLVPGTPKDIITYLACLTKMKMWKFMLITSIARIPSIITSTWCGAEILNQNFYKAIIIFVLTTLFSVLGLFVFRKIERKRSTNKLAA